MLSSYSTESCRLLFQNDYVYLFAVTLIVVEMRESSRCHLRYRSYKRWVPRQLRFSPSKNLLRVILARSVNCSVLKTQPSMSDCSDALILETPSVDQR